jgi:hypothetical protein
MIHESGDGLDSRRGPNGNIANRNTVADKVIFELTSDIAFVLEVLQCFIRALG